MKDSYFSIPQETPQVEGTQHINAGDEFLREAEFHMVKNLSLTGHSNPSDLGS